MKTRVGAEPTAEDIATSFNLKDKNVIITGGASGIGVETARALAQSGANITLAVRNTVVAKSIVEDIKKSTGNHNIYVEQLDLTDLNSIQKFSKLWGKPLHYLFNNAGIMACPFRLSQEGWELQFATNHMGHFALSLALFPLLKEAGGAKIISVSSIGHFAADIHYEDIHYQKRDYNPWDAYGQSKTANVLFAMEATKRWGTYGITANSLMPGAIMTNLQKHVPQKVLDKWKSLEEAGKMPFKTPQQGAATSIAAALLPEFSAGGFYLEDCQAAKIIENDARAREGVRKWAVDEQNAEKLWEHSLYLLEQADFSTISKVK